MVSVCVLLSVNKNLLLVSAAALTNPMTAAVQTQSRASGASSEDQIQHSASVTDLLLAHSDTDILDEFLDQRVYDSLTTNTPSAMSPMANAIPQLLLNPNLISTSFLTSKLEGLDANANASNVNLGAIADDDEDELLREFYPSGNLHSQLHKLLLLLPQNLASFDIDSAQFMYPFDNHPEQDGFPQARKHLQPKTEPYIPLASTANIKMEDLNMAEIDDPNDCASEPAPNVPVPKPFFPNNSLLSDYDVVREEFSKVTFGNHNMNPCPQTLQVLDKSYLDFSPEAMKKLPYTLELSSLPSFSRVETQIKLKFQLLPPPPQILLHVPQDLIYKNKFCLADPVESLSEKLKKSMLYMDAYVLTSDLKVSCGICSRCIKREQKRASRRKLNNGQGDPDDFEAPTTSTATTSASSSTNGVMKNNPNSWANDKMMKKAVIFNCKELVSFPPPNGLNTDLSKSLELSVRIICYCRHHKEAEGFKLLFVIKNYEGEVVAKQLSSSIMIMDRKKNMTMPVSTPLNNSLPGSTMGSSSNLQALNHSNSFSDISGRFSQQNNDLHITSKSNLDDSLMPLPGQMMQPLSPNSIDESTSDPHTTNTDSVPGLFSSLHQPASIGVNSWGNGNTSISANNGLANGRKRKKLSVDDSLNDSTNPMYNGSTNGFSPVSNSDTNTSVTNSSFVFKPTAGNHAQGSFSNGVGVNGSAIMPSQPQPQIHLQPSSLINGSPFAQTYVNNPMVPSIQKIIPAQGPIRGGIEVTLLGFNFRPGLQVKFGSNLALATHCWSETTIVTYLPPANQPGQVLVTFDNPMEENSSTNLVNNTATTPNRNGSVGTSIGSVAQPSGIQHQQIFTYNDDTDRQLIELALQIVGLKMNGKLEDAKNIARRIVNSDNTGGNENSSNNGGSTSNKTTSYKTQPSESDREWFVNASKAVENLTKSDMATEEILIDFLSLVDLPNCPIIIPNWQLCNDQGQTLLHLSTLKNYGLLVRFLISHGCKVDVKDTQGITPLFLASMCGYRSLIAIFMECKSKWNIKLSNDKYLMDYCDMNVLDMFNSVGTKEEISDGKFNGNESLSKSVSMDSLNSLFTMGIGRHISRMAKDVPASLRSSGERDTDIRNSESTDVNDVEGSGSLSSPTIVNGSLKRVKPLLSTRQRLENVVENVDQLDEDDELGFADDEDACNNDYDYLEYSEEDSDLEYLEDDYSDFEEEYEEGNVIASQPVLGAIDVTSASTTPGRATFDEDNMSVSSSSTIIPPGTSIARRGIWSKMASFLNKEDEVSAAGSAATELSTRAESTQMEESLPSYDDLFPFGPYSHSKPKTRVERELNAHTTVNGASSSSDVVAPINSINSDEELMSSDSSEDMVMSYINRPRKTVENDKMLLFFWFPTLVLVVGIFLLMSVFDYKFTMIENIKQLFRMLLGNLLVGNERIARVFGNEGLAT